MTSKLLLLWIITTHFAFTWMFVHFMLKACTNTMKDNFPNQNKWICTCCIQLLCGWALQGSGHAEGHHTCILSKQQHLSWAYPCSDGSFNLPNPALTQPHLSHWKLQAQTVTQQGGSAWRQHVRTQQGPVHLLDHLNSTTRVLPTSVSLSTTLEAETPGSFPGIVEKELKNSFLALSEPQHTFQTLGTHSQCRYNN